MKGFLISLTLIVIAIAGFAFGLRLLFPLPDIDQRPATNALPASADTALASAVLADTRRHPDQSGVLPLVDGIEALRSRLVLLDQAEASIDIQYYIWHDDVSGNLMLDALQRAGERGVRVRLLLDDNGIRGLDPTLAALNAQPNISIRLFNPSTIRNPHLAGFVIDPLRMNRRMHNKSLIVDGVAAVIGGRNIGDEYFQIGEGNFFFDLDVLAVGAIVPDTASAFDDYWNSDSVFKLENIISPEAADQDGFDAAVTEAVNSPAGQLFTADSSQTASLLQDGTSRLEWTDVALVVDDPVKGQGKAKREQLMITRLGGILGDIRQGVDVVSAYFIPGKVGEEWFADVAATGAEVRILTNALITTDVLMVHSGYVKYRKELLQAGVKLFEMKSIEGAPEGRDELKSFGLSGASLHAKSFSIDRERIFIGSFNFDPRSALLNCEIGFLIDSPSLARQLSEAFDTQLLAASWQPQLNDDGMVWLETGPDDEQQTLHQEPGSSWWQRLTIIVLGWLPIEWLL